MSPTVSSPILLPFKGEAGGHWRVTLVHYANPNQAPMAVMRRIDSQGILTTDIRVIPARTVSGL